MQTVVWILSGAALGAGCGYGALLWARRMLRARSREEWLSVPLQTGLFLAVVLCGGFLGGCTDLVVPLLVALALLAIGMAVAVCDGLCRLIPNPTVLAVFAVKLFLMAAALLHIPGVPPVGFLSSLGGMAVGFLIFSLPGLMGRQVGAGDIKLAAAMGFLLGVGGALVAVAFMGVLMLGYSMVQRKMPLLQFLKTDIPMGPFIAAGMLLVWTLPYLPL